MPLKTGTEYIATIKALNLESHILGKNETGLTDHPLIQPSVSAVAATFDGAHSADEQTRQLFRASAPGPRSAMPKSTASPICTRAPGI